jgi:RNA polymerase sigma-70 factor (ECF subfamily)
MSGMHSEKLRAAVGGDMWTRVEEIPGLESRLDAAIEEAHRSWPTLAIPDEAYLAHLGGKVAEADDPALFLQRLRPADLYLACACALGNRAALAAVELECLGCVDQWVRRIDASPAFADEVRQELRRSLLCAEPPEAPRVAAFSGAGDLCGWFRVCAWRVALRLLAQSSKEKVAGARPVDEMPAEGDVELAILKAEYAGHFQRAFDESIRELTARDRTLLRMHYADGLSLDAIAKMYRVHRATVVRQLERARAHLGATVRRRLETSLDAERSEIESILRLIRSRMDVSIGSALRGEGA